MRERQEPELTVYQEVIFPLPLVEPELGFAWLYCGSDQTLAPKHLNIKIIE